METLLLTNAEAAKALHISVDTLTELRDAGKIRCVRIGSRVYYSPDELRAFITKEGQMKWH
jgi:excisionase family DNA binding protein